MKIAIAGAGIAGLACAALLARQGHSVLVYDQFPAPRPVGSGLMIQPVGLAVLARLGLEDRAIAASSPIRRVLGLTAGDRRILDLDYSRLRSGASGFAIQRAALFEMLLDAARSAGAELVPDTAIRGYDSDGKAAWLITERGPASRVEMVLDCLGASSPLCPKPSRPLCYGALWGLLDWPDDAGFAPDRLEQRYRRASQMAGVLPVGSGPRGRLKLTFFWSLRGSDYAKWRASDLHDWKEEVRGLWPQTAPLLDQISRHDDLVFAQYTHRTLASPGHGRLAHLGDSYHATSPQLGQGANMALLDAAALAAATERFRDAKDAIRDYSRRRRWHVLAYQSISWFFTPFYQSDLAVLPWLRDRALAPVSFRWPMPQILARMIAGELLPTGLGDDLKDRVSR